jgi:hypothetical protein
MKPFDWRWSGGTFSKIRGDVLMRKQTAPPSVRGAKSVRTNLLVGAAALFSTPFLALPASAATCTTASVETYAAAGFSCNVGNVLFSDIDVSVLTTGSGFVELGNFTPFSTGTEFGLSMNFIAATGNTANSSADIAWMYNVSALPGFLLHDVFASVAGNTTGTGMIFLSEVLSNGTTISINGAGSQTVFFDPIASLGVVKDQFNFAGPAGFAATSVIQNGFSTVAVPGPIAGAGIPALMALGLVWARRRKAADPTTA